MKIQIHSSRDETGSAAAQKAIAILRGALSSKSKARFIAATGVSQYKFLEIICQSDEIDWKRSEMFHLDSYIGLPVTHPASFRRYLNERLVNKIHPGKVFFINGNTPDPIVECKRVGALIREEKVDVAFIGIGENGHIAFNDPPADFETEEPYIIVNLDDRCRQQQVGEGWFKSIEEVPQQAISMSIKQIMKAEHIICTCPEKRKAEAVRDCLSKDVPVSPLHPASILKQHENAHVFLDKESASLLKL